jgi:hypothetical protein
MIELSVLNEKGDNWWVGVTGPQLKILRQAGCVESVAASWGTRFQLRPALFLLYLILIPSADASQC